VKYLDLHHERHRRKENTGVAAECLQRRWSVGERNTEGEGVLEQGPEIGMVCM
jgi:hypothetical protein